MSKTMDNDNCKPFGDVPLIVAQAAEIERLKAELRDCKQDLAAEFTENLALRAQVEAKDLGWSQSQDECRDLRARVEELEGLLTTDMSRLGHNIRKIEQERDALRQQLAARVLRAEEERDAFQDEVQRISKLWLDETDALREDARNFSNMFDQLNAKYLALRAELEELRIDYLAVNKEMVRRGVELEGESATLKVTQKLLREKMDELATHKGYQQEWMDRAFKAEAELAATKPVPVVEVRYTQVDNSTLIGEDQRLFFTSYNEEMDNLKLTFTDGKLTGAEVVG